MASSSALDGTTAAGRDATGIKPFEVMVDGEEEEVAKAKPTPPLVATVNASEADDVDAMRKVLESLPSAEEALAASDAAGMTALMQAAWKGKIKTIKFLIDQVFLIFP